MNGIVAVASFTGLRVRQKRTAGIALKLFSVEVENDFFAAVMGGRVQQNVDFKLEQFERPSIVVALVLCWSLQSASLKEY